MKYFFSALLFFVFLMPAKAQTSAVNIAGCVEGNCNEGIGKYLFENGDKFNGEWHADKRSGYGRYDYKNGDWYIGDFKNDLIEGRGVFHWASGKVVSGLWENYVLVKIDDQKYASDLNLKLPTMQFKNK